MIQLLGSRVKAGILLYLALRGGCSGRNLARKLRMQPSQIFKALHQLETAGIVDRYGRSLYILDTTYPFYADLLSILNKEAEIHPSSVRSFLPLPDIDRRVDPMAVYEMISLRGPAPRTQKISDLLKERYG